MAYLGNGTTKVVSLVLVISLFFTMVQITPVLLESKVKTGEMGSGLDGVRYQPDMLNVTLNTFEQFNQTVEHFEDIVLFGAGQEGGLRLSTGLPDMIIDGVLSTDEPLYGETIVLRPGAVLTPDQGDSVEVHARNFIMEAGSLIDVSFRGDSMSGEGGEGGESDSQYQDEHVSGGGGGGGGGYGGEGGQGGKGPDDNNYEGDPGDAGVAHGSSNLFEISSGSRGGVGGDSDTDGGQGGMGGGSVSIIASNIELDGTIMANGEGGEVSLDTAILEAVAVVAVVGEFYFPLRYPFFIPMVN